jgi:hypothetical protein
MNTSFKVDDEDDAERIYVHDKEGRRVGEITLREWLFQKSAEILKIPGISKKKETEKIT